MCWIWQTFNLPMLDCQQVVRLCLLMWVLGAGWFVPASLALSVSGASLHSVSPSPHTDSHWHFSLKVLTIGKVWPTTTIFEFSSKKEMSHESTLNRFSWEFLFLEFSWLSTLNLTLIAIAAEEKIQVCSFLQALVEEDGCMWENRWW